MERVFVNIADYLGMAAAADQESGEKSGASFFFSPEDEEEIRRVSQKINGYGAPRFTADQVEAKANEIIAEIQINFGSEALANRFKQIIKTYLSGIRDRITVRETLKKTFESGGLGFDEESAEQVLAITDTLSKSPVKQVFAPPRKITVPEDLMKAAQAREGAPIPQEKLDGLKNIGARDIDYDFSYLIGKRGGAKTEQPAVEETQADQPMTQTFRREENAPLSGGGKVRMEDVKVMPGRKIFGGKKADRGSKPQVMSPVDELSFMELVDFRRLSSNPGGAADKIKEKIDLLEEEHYGKKAEGVKSWRQSPVNRLYLEMGAESISGKKPINVIIEERKNSGAEYLTGKEFEAIMDLNRELRF